MTVISIGFAFVAKLSNFVQVFVKILNIAITKTTSSKLQSIMVIVFIIDCIKLAQIYVIKGNVTAVAKEPVV